MKKALAIALGGMMIFASCTKTEPTLQDEKPDNTQILTEEKPEEKPDSTQIVTEEDVQDEDSLMVGMPNPFSDFENLDDAIEQAGFAITLPESIPSGYVAKAYRTLNTGDKMLEIIYENENKEIRIRKGKGEKISGVYSRFPQISEININGKKVLLSGLNDKVQLAEWKNGTFSYSISATTYTRGDSAHDEGLLKEEMLSMVKDITTE